MADTERILALFEDKFASLERRFVGLESTYSGLVAERNEKGHSIDSSKDFVAGALNANAEIAEVKCTLDKTQQTGSEDGNVKPSPVQENVSEPPKPMESRVQVIVSKRKQDGEWEEHDSDQKDDEPQKKQQNKYASVLRKIIHSDRENTSKIEIMSIGLRNMLRELLKRNPWHTFLGDTVLLYSPYEDLLMDWDLLWEEAKKPSTKIEEREARSDLQELLRTISKGSGDPKLDTYLKMRDSLSKQKSITFECLWTIFCPGTIVYGQLFLGHDQIFIVEDYFTPWPRDEGTLRGQTPKEWSLKCWTYDWHDGSFQRRSVTLTFEVFEGQKPLGSLPYHPIDANENCDSIKRGLLERGRKFKKLCTAKFDESMYKYNGVAIFDKKGFQGLQFDDSETMDEDRWGISADAHSRVDASISAIVNSDVMVDFDSYHKYGPGISKIGAHRVSENTTQCICADCKVNKDLMDAYKTKYDGMKGTEDEEWENLQFMLCPPRVLGYVLRDKHWAQLDVGKLQEIPPTNAEEVLQKLHLRGECAGRQTKELLLGLVKHHGSSRGQEKRRGYQIADIVAEKGQGLFILLYGSPGVGKTSTAQSVAVATRKPLLSIGVADVGTKAKHVESNLETIFDLATTWKAILLIDEADVFLQSRNRLAGASTERSALVSVFLRVLEYYQGILFLTTNQIAQFDVAVQSRIHIAIKYEDLNDAQTTAIFEQFLMQYEINGRVDDAKGLMEWIKRELPRKGFDGRQIRNVVTSAMGYAVSKDEKLKLDHVLHVAGIVEDFKKDLAYQMMQWKEAQNNAKQFQ